ncbi:MAG: ferredoxin family 2Fe-2S iron-sulfur cluster binding protein [Rhodospirillaceae bacterium]|jgi:2Fe-2S ferredoxin
MPKVVFIENSGERREIEAPAGKSLLDIAHANNIDIEGACEGVMACSTCHLIVDSDWYEKLKPASEEEDDMLDLAFSLTKTSRLGCQILLTEELDGLVVNLPVETRNMML